MGRGWWRYYTCECCGEIAHLSFLNCFCKICTNFENIGKDTDEEGDEESDHEYLSNSEDAEEDDFDDDDYKALFGRVGEFKINELSWFNDHLVAQLN